MSRMREMDRPGTALCPECERWIGQPATQIHPTWLTGAHRRPPLTPALAPLTPAPPPATPPSLPPPPAPPARLWPTLLLLPLLPLLEALL
eukprot:COSAG01_NODE_475_length_16519_cov_168.890621_18_plen_90_part_00